MKHKRIVDEKEDKIVESIVKKTKLIAKEIQLDSNLDYVLHGDNIKIKLNITNDR